MKKNTENLIKALKGYFKAKDDVRKLIRRHLCSDPCFSYIISNCVNGDEKITTYGVLLEVVSPRALTELIHNSEGSKELRDSVEYYFEGLEICNDLNDEKINYLSHLLFRLAHIIFKFNAELAALSFESHDDDAPQSTSSQPRQRSRYRVHETDSAPREDRSDTEQSNLRDGNTHDRPRTVRAPRSPPPPRSKSKM